MGRCPVRVRGPLQAPILGPAPHSPILVTYWSHKCRFCPPRALDEVATAFSKEIRELASEAVEVLIARVGFDENGMLRISLPVEPVPGLQKRRLEIKLAHRDLAAYDPQLAETSGWARQRKAGQAIVEGYMMLYGAGAKDGGQQVNFKPDRFQGPP